MVVAFLKLRPEYETFLLVPCLLNVREHFFKVWSLLVLISVVFHGKTLLLTVQVAELCYHQNPHHNGNQSTRLCRLDMSARNSMHGVSRSCQMKIVNVTARLFTAFACLAKRLHQICLPPKISLPLSALGSTPLYELIQPSYTAIQKCRSLIEPG